MKTHHPIAHFSKVKKDINTSIHWAKTVFSFSMFQKLLLHTTLSHEREGLRSLSNSAMLLEPQKHVQVRLLCSSGFFCESIWLHCFPLFNPCAYCRQGEPEFLRNANLLLFHISFHCRDISSFSFIDNGLRFLQGMVLSNTKWQCCRSARNERHNANGAATRGGTRAK